MVARVSAGSGKTEVEVYESLMQEKFDGLTYAEMFEKYEPEPDPHFLAMELLEEWVTGEKTLDALAEEALAIDPDCADAYLLLARESIETEDVLAALEKAAEAGRRKYRAMLAGGRSEAEVAKDGKTLPYLDALHDLADFQLLSSSYEGAAAVYGELFALDPEDSRDLRPALLEIAFAEENWDEAERLLDALPSERSCTALYGRAYLEFMRSLEEHPDFDPLMSAEDPFAKLQSPRANEARRVLRAAFEASPWVVPFLLDLRCALVGRVDVYTEGDPYEALEFVRLHFAAWSVVGVPSIWMITEFSKFSPNANLRKRLRLNHEAFLDAIEIVGEVEESGDEDDEEEEEDTFSAFREISERIIEMLIDEAEPPKRGRRG